MRKLLTLALAVLMLVSMATTASAAFTDVSADNEALSEAVELLSTLGVAKGTTETTFGPDELVTRQQMAAFTYRLMKAGKSSEGGVNATPFKDLEDSTFFNMISWASQTGVIKGTSATTFNPKGNITLQDAYTMLVRALGYEKDQTLQYPFGYIEQAEAIGLDEDLPSSVDYTTNLTRGNIAILLANAFYADMNEKTVEYVWEEYKTSGGDVVASKVAKEVQETVASKIFGVKEEKLVITGTAHYGLGSTATWSTKDGIDKVYASRWSADGETQIEAAREYEFEDIKLDGKSDDYFLAEVTLFVKKDADGNVADDVIIAAQSNLVKKTVTPDKVVFDRSAEEDEEYFVDKDEKEDKVLTGLVTFDGMGVYLDKNNAPYSYRTAANNQKLGTADPTKVANVQEVKFLTLTGGTYAKDGHSKYNYTATNSAYTGTFDTDTDKDGAYDDLTELVKKDDTTGLQYALYNGLYEAEVYDTDGDNYAEYVFIKPFDFVQLENKKASSTATGFTYTATSNEIKTIDIRENVKADIKGVEYKSEDYVLAYVNTAANLIEVKEVITPVEAKVTGAKTTAGEYETITLSNGTNLEFITAAKRVKYLHKDNTYANLQKALGKTQKLYVKDDILLYNTSIINNTFDLDGNYAIIRPYETNKDGSVKNMIFTATGYVDGKLVNNYFVTAIINGAEKQVKLGDYAYSKYYFDDNAQLKLGSEIDDVKITEKTAAEQIMTAMNGKLVSFTTNSDGAHTFSELDLPTTAGSIYTATDKEEAVVVYDASATMEHYSGNWYKITADKDANAPASFYVKDYTKITTMHMDGVDKVYTTYTAETLPKFDTTTVSNMVAVFINNKASSTVENLAYLYIELGKDGFTSGATKDYVYLVSTEDAIDEDGDKITTATTLDIKTGNKTAGVEFANDGVKAEVGKLYTLNEAGEIDNQVTPESKYVEGKLFSDKFASYEEGILDIANDSNVYRVTDETTVLRFKSVTDFELIAAEDYEDILVLGVDNAYIDLAVDVNDNPTETFVVYIVAEDDPTDDKNADILVAKTIVVIDGAVAK